MALRGVFSGMAAAMSYEYRIRPAGPHDWRVERQFGFGGWVKFAVCDNEIDADTISRALKVIDDSDGTHQWFTSEDGPQCVRCGKTYWRGMPNCRGSHW